MVDDDGTGKFSACGGEQFRPGLGIKLLGIEERYDIFVAYLVLVSEAL
jgi:hypothetical protein